MKIKDKLLYIIKHSNSLISIDLVLPLLCYIYQLYPNYNLEIIKILKVYLHFIATHYYHLNQNNSYLKASIRSLLCISYIIQYIDLALYDDPNHPINLLSVLQYDEKIFQKKCCRIKKKKKVVTSPASKKHKKKKKIYMIYYINF